MFSPPESSKLKIIQISTRIPYQLLPSIDRSTIHPLLSNEEAQLPFPQEIKQPPPLSQSSLAQTTVRSFFPCKNDARFRGTVAGYEHGSRLFITDSRATKQAAFRSVFQFRPILWDYSRTTRKRCAALVNVVSPSWSPTLRLYAPVHDGIPIPGRPHVTESWSSRRPRTMLLSPIKARSGVHAREPALLPCTARS